MKKSAIVFLLFSLVLTSCGAKKNVATQSEKIALQDQGVLVATDAEIEKPTLGLLWQNDQLQITLNQGRQLDFYRAETDTLYLYETARDTADHSTRKYTLNIPTRELLIIKYNDSLVYPLMPITEPCEYPLNIKSMGAKKLEEYYEREKEKERIRKEQIEKGTYLAGGVLNAYLLAPELRAGTYLYNAGLYQLGTTCDCVIDSTKTLILNLDGSWQQYEDGKLKNCGIMRKTGFPVVYDMYDYKQQTALFLDTTAIAGHVISIKEDRRRWNEHIPYAPNEYLNLGRASMGMSYEFFKLYSCKQENAMPFLFGGAKDNFWFEGTRCGWQRIMNK